MTDTGERYKWLDFARGLAMILVIIGHSGIDNVIFKFIYIFHMALFYMISGCLNKKRDIEFKQYVKNISKKYLIPYLKYSLIGITITFTFPGIYGVKFSWSQLAHYAFGIAVARGAESYTGNWGAVWFLISQFWLLIMAFIINKYDNKYLTLLCCALGPLSTLSVSFVLHRYIYHSTWIIWNIGASLMALPIYYIGYYLNIYMPKIKEQNKFKIILLSLAAIILGLFIGNLNPSVVAFTNNSYGSDPLALIEFFIGACLVPIGIIILLADIYIYNRFFEGIEWIGKHTVAFLGIHCMTIVPINKLLEFIPQDLRWAVTAIFVIVIDSALIYIAAKIKEKLYGYFSRKMIR